MSAALALLNSDQIIDPPTHLIVDKYSSGGRRPHNLTVLVPCRGRDGTRAYPGKSYARGPDGSLESRGFNLRTNRVFDAHQAPVACIEDLHDVLLRVQERRLGIVVPGRLLNPERRTGVRRLVNDRPGCPATLASVPLPWLLLDLDKVPNIHGLDPRTQPDEARNWLLSLLPWALRRARCVVRWSSSTCVGTEGPPATLSAHAWFWLDGLLARAEAKATCMAVDSHIRRALSLTARPRGNGGWLCDWKTTEGQQPIYVAPPLCEDGVADPFAPGERTVLAGGPDPEVVLDDLRAELEQYAGQGQPAGPAPARTTRKAGGAKRPGTEAKPWPRPERPARAPLVLPATPLLHRDHPLVLEIRAHTMQARKEAAGKRAVDAVLGAGRAAAELVRIALARVEWGREHDDFGAWAEVGGVSEGERDMWLYSVAACLAHALPAERVLDGSLRDLVTRVGETICGSEWTATGWVKDRCDGAVIAKAVQAARGESIVRDGRRWDPRYRWSAAALRRDLGIGDDEGRALGLLTLAEGATEKRSRRALVSLRKPEPAPDARTADRAEVVRLRAKGLSLRAVSARTGVPVGTVQAWGAKAAVASTADGVGGRSVTPSTRLGSQVEKSERVGSLSAIRPVPAAEAVPGTALPIMAPPVLDELPAAALHVPACPAPYTPPAPPARPPLALPSFILRRLAAREAEREGAARYVRHVSLLVAEMAQRGAEPPRSWPAQPSTERLPPALAAEVEAAAVALRQALASSHRRRDARRSRRESSGERDAFWAGCKAELMRDPLEAARMADERLAAIQESWRGRVDRVARRAAETRDEADGAAAANTRMAGRSVLKAERRRYEALLGFQTAA